MEMEYEPADSESTTIDDIPRRLLKIGEDNPTKIFLEFIIQR